ncbi:minor capsid protein [Kribbella sp. NPDC051718]|uniref:minor capsid protein n=1 Tax=Kribbella sp. NPDC051718 TaxID=3155168 RepID=UPI00341DB9F9
MGFTTDLLTGLATRWHNAGIAVYQATGAYAANDIAIVLGVPGQNPAAQIALAVYNNGDDATLSDSTPMVQVRFRGQNADPVGADDLADAVFDDLQGFTGNLPNGIRVVFAKRNSTFPLGIDGNGRQERTDNYELTVHRPSAHRE